MPNFVTEYKTIFWKSEANLESFQKRSPYIGVFYTFFFEVCQNFKSKLLSHGILIQGFIMRNFNDAYKTIFLEKQGKP